MNLLAFADAAEVAEQATDTVSTTFRTSKDAVWESFSKAYDQVIAIAPQIVAMVVVVVIGYVVARFVAKAITTLAEKVGLQNAADQSGLADSMHHMGLQRNVPAIIGTIVFWLLMCVFLMAGFNILGLSAVTDAMQEIVHYIPKLLVATVLVVVGLLVATFLRGVVATSADRVGLTYAEYLANGCYYVFALLTFIAAFKQLGVQFDLLENLILIAFGAVAVGFGLAFGLGGRDVMARHSGRLLHSPAPARRRPRHRRRPGRHGSRGRTRGHDHRDRRGRPVESPQRAQYQDAQRSSPVSTSAQRTRPGGRKLPGPFFAHRHHLRLPAKGIIGQRRICRQTQGQRFQQALRDTVERACLCRAAEQICASTLRNRHDGGHRRFQNPIQLRLGRVASRGGSTGGERGGGRRDRTVGRSQIADRAHQSAGQIVNVHEVRGLEEIVVAGLLADLENPDRRPNVSNLCKGRLTRQQQECRGESKNCQDAACRLSPNHEHTP